MLSFPPSTLVRIFVARDSVDMRKGIDGLAGLVIDVIEQDPQSGHLFVFFNRHRNRMKSLVWDGSGYWLLVKRTSPADPSRRSSRKRDAGGVSSLARRCPRPGRELSDVGGLGRG